MSRYQLGEHVWSIELVGHRLTVVEPDGTTRVEELAPDLASTRLRVLINQKLRAGWKLVVEPPAAALPSTPTVENARNPELEAVLLADPDHVPSWLVYGDWLQQQGDPRGTHIALRAAACAAPDDLVVAERLRKHETRYWNYLTGGFDGRLGWGFLDEYRNKEVDELAVLAAPAGRFVTRLELFGGSMQSLDNLVAAIARHAPITLRELAIESFKERAFAGTLDSLESIEAELSRLRVLDLDLPVSQRCLDHLAHTPLPMLQRLVWSHSSAWTLQAMLSRDLPSLVELQIHLFSAESLAASPNARRLERLELISVDEDQVEELADLVARDAFPALRHLQLPTELLDLERVRYVLADLEVRLGPVTRSG